MHVSQEQEHDNQTANRVSQPDSWDRSFVSQRSQPFAGRQTGGQTAQKNRSNYFFVVSNDKGVFRQNKHNNQTVTRVSERFTTFLVVWTSD